MQGPLFSKKPVALAVSVALSSVAAAATQAQEPAAAAPGVLEEVVVTGIRSSLMRAMDTKRDSTGVVDAISAEDIGDFPDTNLAEALQRITGVSIDRQRGEGTTVTVRGFGADFNLVTLNGRQMPTHAGFGRSFDFQDIAAESVSGVEVYKTSRANVPTGGIGATINILTTKPLDNPGLRTSLSAKAVYDESTREGDEVTPEIAGFISQTFLDDTLGIAISGSFQERHNGQASASTDGWVSRDGSTIRDNGAQTNLPADTDIVSIPQRIRYKLDEWERTRINGQATLQWQPIPTLTLTADYTMAELELENRYNSMTYFYNRTSDIVTWSDGPVVSPLLYDEITGDDDLVLEGGLSASKNSRDGVGINIAWDPTDRLSLFLDWHDSTAERGPDPSAPSSNTLVALQTYGRLSAETDFRNEIPIVRETLADPLSPDDMRIAGSIFSNDWGEMNIQQTRFGGTFDLTDTIQLEFGVTDTDVENFSSSSLIQRNTWGIARTSAYGSVQDLLVPATLTGVFNELQGGDQVNNQFFTFDPLAVIERGNLLTSLPASNPLNLPLQEEALISDTGFGPCGNGFCAEPNRGFGDQFLEETMSIYLQASYAGELFDRPFNARIGYRYEETDVTSSAESPEFEAIVWGSPNEFTITRSGNVVPSDLTGNYDVGLPNFDFDIEVIQDMIFRASYSETIARAGYADLRGTVVLPSVIFVNNGVFQGDASLGNPGLIPFESENLDFSLEYYYDDASYISIGYFDKNVSNWIGSTITPEVVIFDDLAHPALGPLYEAAINELGITADNPSIRDFIFTNFPNEPGVDVATGSITGVPGRDGGAFFDVSTLSNSDQEVNIDGWEMAWQHNFWDTGFGFIVNATFADGDAKFDINVRDPQFTLPGLADTRNFVAFYETDYFQIRAAYNWRDTYLAGAGLDPNFVEEYEQWDVSASYEFGESGIIAFVEGINVTNETFRTISRSPTQVGEVGVLGARYNIGVRYQY